MRYVALLRAIANVSMAPFRQAMEEKASRASDLRPPTCALVAGHPTRTVHAAAGAIKARRRTGHSSFG
jgi:hypothetical protein